MVIARTSYVDLWSILDIAVVVSVPVCDWMWVSGRPVSGPPDGLL